MVFSFCDKTVQDKLNHVTLCEHYSAVIFDVCFIMIAHLKTKLYVSSKHATLSYLYLPNSEYHCDN